MGIVVIVQARMASSRLPGKVLLPAAGKPLLWHMLMRLRAASRVRHLVVATTHDSNDDAIVKLCERLGVEHYRGDPVDCLDRHYQVGLRCGADAIVKIPSDCPLIDPAAIDHVLGTYQDASSAGIDYDYVSNLHPATWPDGNDVEVVSMRALRCAWAEAVDPFDREHTTPFVWSKPERFRLGNVRWQSGLDFSLRYRLVVDWIEDYELVREVIEHLQPRFGVAFGTEPILDLLAANPSLTSLNQRHIGYNYYATHYTTQQHPTMPAAFDTKENTG